MNRKTYVAGLAAFFLSLTAGFYIQYLTLSSALFVFGGLLLGIALAHEAFRVEGVGRFAASSVCMVAMVATLYLSPVGWVGYLFWVVFAVAPPVMLYMMAGEGSRKLPAAIGLAILAMANVMFGFALASQSCEPFGSAAFTQIYLLYAVSLAVFIFSIVKGRLRASAIVVLVAAALVFVLPGISQYASCPSGSGAAFSAVGAMCDASGTFRVTVSNTGGTAMAASDWDVAVAKNSTARVPIEAKPVQPGQSAEFMSKPAAGSHGSEYDIIISTKGGIRAAAVMCT